MIALLVCVGDAPSCVTAIAKNVCLVMSVGDVEKITAINVIHWMKYVEVVNWLYAMNVH